MNDPAANSHIRGDSNSSVPVTSASPVLSSLSATKSLRGKRVNPPSNSNPTGRSGILVSLATDTPVHGLQPGSLKKSAEFADLVVADFSEMALFTQIRYKN
jgi:hypothetical protein